MSSALTKIKIAIHWYGFWGSIRLLLDLIHTRILYPRARLVRRPCRVRSTTPIQFNRGFTSGTDLRVDLFEQGILEVGERVQVNDHVHIGVACKVSIGEDTLIASRVFITDHDHGEYADALARHSSPDVPPAFRPLVTAPVTIGKRVWLGEGVSVLMGVTIGDGAVIGAGAVVNKDIPANCIAVGIPARVIKHYCNQSGRWESV